MKFDLFVPFPIEGLGTEGSQSNIIYTYYSKYILARDLRSLALVLGPFGSSLQDSQTFQSLQLSKFRSLFKLNLPQRRTRRVLQSRDPKGPEEYILIYYIVLTLKTL